MPGRTAAMSKEREELMIEIELEKGQIGIRKRKKEDGISKIDI